MKRISSEAKWQWMFLWLAGLMTVGMQAQTLPNDPTTKWVPMPYPTNVVSDYIDDQQTGSAEGDIVGTNALSATYSAFNFGSSPTNGLQGHRVRLGADASPAGFKAVYHVGIDGDLDGDLDIFVSVDNSGSGDFIRIFPAGNGLNISPATTTIDSQNPLFTYAAGSSNYNWSPVTPVMDPAVTNSTLPAPTNIDGATGGLNGGADYFLSFFVPFQDMVSAFNTVGVTNITTNSLFRYIMATATQPNSLNQDINGLSSVTGLFTNIYNPPLTPGGSTNRPPVANPDFATTPEDVAILIPALVNDTDLDTNTLTLHTVSTTNGTASITGTNVLFTPATNFVGTVLLTYTINDGTVSNAVGFITVNVTPVNDPPFANDDTSTTPEDTTVTIPVLVNDGDVDANPLTIVNVVTTNGSVSISGTNLVFTPAPNFFGVVVLTYTISDGVVSNISARVTVNVTPVNDDPIALPDVAGATVNTPRTYDPRINDSDPDGDALTITDAIALAGSVTFTGTNVVFTPPVDFLGSVQVLYTISDGNGGSSAATITFDITSGNNPPAANNDSVTTPEDLSLTIPVLVNDSDPDGDVLTIIGATTTNGTVSIAGTNLVFTPGTNFNGVVVLSYVVLDGTTNTDGAIVTVTVTPVNDAPVANNDAYTLAEDTSLNIPAAGVLMNDSDVEGGALTALMISDVANGVLTFNANGSFTYSPATNFFGVDTFTYRVTDGSATSGVATVTFTITPVNDAPVVLNDVTNVLEDASVTVQVLVNDFDPEGTPLVITGANTTNGLAVVSGTNVVFTPATNYVGTVVFTYNVTDGTNSGTGSVTVTVSAVNDAPIALNDSYSTPEDTTLNVSLPGVLGNDADVESDPLTALLVSGPTSGALTLNGDGSFTYAPQTNFSGSVSFTYRATDGSATSAVVTVTINVTPVNDAPLANGQSVSTPEDTALPITLTGSDVEGNPLRYILVSGPANGVVSGFNTNSGALTYTPNTNFNGSDALTFRVNDGFTNSALAMVSITVTPVNDAPLASSQFVTTPEDTALLITLTGSDVEGAPLTFILVSGPANGSISGFNTNTGTLSFLPNTNYSGADSFTFRVNDGTMNSGVATVSITVTPMNDAPLANNQSVSTPEDTALPIALTGSDIEGAVLTYILVGGPANGTLSGFNTNTGALTYTPGTNYNGADSLTFRVSDGTNLSAIATVSIMVTPVNDAPYANNDFTGTPKNVPITINVLANDSDADGNPITISGQSTTNGTVSVVGTNLFFTPVSNYVGQVVLTYSITDGSGSGSALVFVNVTTGTNTPPVANNDAVSVPEDTTLTFDPRANDTDADGDPLFISAVVATNGTVNVVGGTNVSHLPSTNFVGTVTLLYTINDGNGGTASAAITVTVTPLNDAPFANNQNVTTPEDTALPITLTGSDVEGSPLAFILVSSPANGVISGFNTNTGALTYTPGANFFGADSFTFRVNDGSSNSAVATVNIAVTPVNDPPAVVNDVTNVLEDTSVTIRVLVNDSDPEGTPLTISNVLTTNGTATVIGTNVLYTPQTNFTGTVVITYTATDGTNSGSATITISVNPVNDAPVANSQNVTTPEDTALPITLTGSDGENSPLTFILVGGPANGAIGGFNTNTGALTYTPNTNFNGTDSFTFRVNDGSSNSVVATVNITVTPVNDAPIANNQSVSTPEDTALPITLTGSDVEASPLTFILVSGPVNGSLSSFNTNTGALTYTPNTNYNGGDSFTFRVSDGTNMSAVATVNISVTGVADSPRAFGQGLTTTEDTPLPITLVGSSPDGNPLTYQLINAPGFGAFVAFNTNSGVLTYQPSTNYNGPDAFTFRVSDGFTNSLLATVNITVTPVNDPPIILNDATNTPSGQPVVVPPLVNDTDPDGGSLQISCALATNGTAVISGTNIIFTPASNFVGTASVTYCATNQTGGSGSGVITVTVVPPVTPTFAIGQGTNYLNPQTGLFEQRVNITNTSVITASALQLLVGNINTPQGVPRTNVWLYNATGTNVDSRPYVLYNSPLNPGQFVTLTLEFVVPDRRPFTNSLEAIAVLPVANGTNSGNGVVVAPPFVDSRFSPARYVIEWTSIPGRTYTVIYSDDNLATWRAATPSVAAVNNRTQWYDDGPPKTASPPVSGSRFYRVILAPQNP